MFHCCFSSACYPNRLSFGSVNYYRSSDFRLKIVHIDDPTDELYIFKNIFVEVEAKNLQKEENREILPKAMHTCNFKAKGSEKRKRWKIFFFIIIQLFSFGIQKTWRKRRNETKRAKPFLEFIIHGLILLQKVSRFAMRPQNFFLAEVFLDIYFSGIVRHIFLKITVSFAS